MAILVQCSLCKNPYWMQNRYYNKNCGILHVTNLIEFNNTYICRMCRPPPKPHIKPYNLHKVPEYKELQKILQQEVNDAVKRGIADPQVILNFQKNVKSILDKKFITEYHYDIRNGELYGIILTNIPFFGDIRIQLNSKGR